MALNTKNDASTEPEKRHRGLWILLAIAAILIFFFVRHFTSNALAIRTATVTRVDLVSTLSTNGNVEPQQNFEAHSPVAGVIKAIYVHEGEHVAKGKLLLTMDDLTAKAQVASALAALRTAEGQMNALHQGGTQDEQLNLSAQIAKARADRDQSQANLTALTQLEKQGAASPSEITAAKTNLAVAESGLQALQMRKTQRYGSIDQQSGAANLANAQAAYQAALDTLQQEDIRAPFAGTVYSAPFQATEYVQAGDALLKLADLSHVQIRAYFDEPEIGKLAVGIPTTIVWDAQPGRIWHGHIIRTPSTIITYGTRHVGEALITVDDADGVLLPNTNVRLTVTTMKLPQVLTIPREALHMDGDSHFVYQVVDGHLHKTSIEVGALNLTQVQVLSGIDAGATVALTATDGTELQNGLAVHGVQ